MNHKFTRLFGCVLLLFISMLACSLQRKPDLPLPPTPKIENTPIPYEATAIVESPTKTRAPSVELRQWAVRARASSEFGSDDWSASQATGAPNTFTCGDQVTAWASRDSNTTEWLEVYFETPVHATAVVIYMTFNPNQVVKIELLSPGEFYEPIYTGEPEEKVCPFVFTQVINQTVQLVDGVRITVDQSILGDWAEIDAVELIGMTE